MPLRAARSRFPKFCPVREPSENRYVISCSMTSSVLARASTQSRASPGGSIPRSCRSMPLPPPSSAIVTIAVMSRTCRFSPRSMVDSPWPPPIATIRGVRPGEYNLTSSSMIPSRSASLNVPVIDHRRISPLGNVFPDCLRHHHGPVSPSGASDCNDQRSLSFLEIQRQRKGQEVLQT